MMPREGTLIADRYRLERKVGGGRVAAMWLVRDQVTEGACAVKLLHRSMNEHPEALARFSLEDRLARELTGVYFPERVGSGSWQSMRYIAWHWYEGECLRALFDRNPKQDVQTVNSIAQETCNALSMVHGAGYTHGDLKPENLFFAERGEKEKEASRQLKLLGFGVASRLSRPLLGAQGRRTPGQIIGTPLYLSPDLILGRVPRGGQADLWALAVIVYEALTGRAPFLGDDLAGVLAAILEKQAPKPTSIAEKLPGSFDLWWAQALEQGFATPAEFATSLSRALAPALRSSRTQRSASLPTSAGASGETVVGTTRSGVAANPSGPTGASPPLRTGIPRASASPGPAAKQASSTPTVPRADGSASKLSRPAPSPGGETATASPSGEPSVTDSPVTTAAPTNGAVRTNGAAVSPNAAPLPAPQPAPAAATAAGPSGTASISAEAAAPTPIAAGTMAAGTMAAGTMAAGTMAGAPVTAGPMTAGPGAIAGAVSARDVGGTTSQGLAPAANIAGAGAAAKREDSSPKAASTTPRAPAVTSTPAPAPRATVEGNAGASGAKDATLSTPELTPHAGARTPTPRAAVAKATPSKATPSKATPSKSPGAATESSAAHTATAKEASNAALFREAVAAATDPGRGSAASPPRPHAAASARRDPTAASSAAPPTALPSSTAPAPKAAFPEAAVQPLSLGTSSTAPGIGPAAVAMIRALQNAAADAAASIRVVGPRTGNFSPLPSPLSDFASTGSRKTLVGIIPPFHAGSPRDEAGTTLPAAASAAPGAAPFVKRTGASGRETVSAIEGAPCKPIEVSEEEDAAEAAYFNNPLRRAGHPTVPFARPRAARRSAARDTVPNDTVPDLDRVFEMDAPPGSAPWTMRTTRTLRLVLTDSGHRPHLVAGMLVCGAAALVIFALGRSPMAGTGALGQSTHSLEPPAGPPNSGSAAQATSSAATPSAPGVEAVPQLAADAPADAPSAAAESGESPTINGTGGADPSAESVNGAAPSPAGDAPAHLAGKEIAPGLVVPDHPASPSAPHSKPEKPKAPETSPPLRVPPGGVLSPTPSLTTNLPNSQKPPGTEPLGAAGRPASVKPGAKRPGTEPGAPRPANGDFDFGI